MPDLKEFQEKGKAVYVPGLEKDSRLLKGWEIGDDFMFNPDYVAPPPPPPKPQVQLRCQKCGTNIPDKSHKGIGTRGGMIQTLILCVRCHNYG